MTDQSPFSSPTLLDLPNIVPLERKTLDGQAYRTVREALMSGQLRPGQAITLRGLAESLGVSRQPVRAALTRLEAEGALVASPTSGTLHIPVLGEDELEQLREMRVHLEGLAARKAAARITPIELDEVRKQCTALEKAARKANAMAYVMANWAFHGAVYRTSAAAILCATIETFWLRVGPHVRVMYPDRDSMLASLPVHWELVDALARHDPEAAATAIAADISVSATALIERRRDANQPTTRARA